MCAVVEPGRSVHRIRRFMRRLIAVLLLALVSLQSSWAVAAAYCGHETSRDAAHFGHHVDGHVTARGDGHGHADALGAQQVDGQADADSLGATVDAAEHGDTDDVGAPGGGHCHDCHASPIGVILPLAQTGVYLSSSAVAAPPLRRLPTPPSQPLERPDWQSLA